MATTTSGLTDAKIVVNAYGQSAGGVAPHFRLLIDGVDAGQANVSSTAATAYTFTAKVASSQSHKVQVYYDNDATVNGVDRNLFVKSVVVNGNSMAPTQASYDRGALDGKDVIAGQEAMYWTGALNFSTPSSYYPAPAPIPTSIVVNAQGTPAGGTNAHFNLLVDGKTIGDGWTGTTAKDYAFTANIVPDAAHKVQVQYDNDAYINGQDRNLIVNQVTIGTKAVLPTASNVTYDKGALDGKDVVAGDSLLKWNGTLVVSADASYFPSGTTSTTTPSSPPPTDTTTSGGTSTDYVRPFGPHAPWNVPVAGLPVDADSAKLSYMMWNNAPDRPGNFNLNNTESFAVYSAKEAAGWYTVDTTDSTNIANTKIPWNPAWQIPADGTDRKVIVLDPDTGREWDLWQTSFDGSVVHATNGSLVPGSYFTYEGGNIPSRGAGIEYLAMLVRPEEFQAGKIDHALAMTIQNTDGSRFVAPATKLEYPGNPPGIPEGTRFALKVTDAQITAWEKTLPADLQTEGHILAVALRDYGWFVTDTSGGGAAFELEARASAGTEWDALGMYQRTVNGHELPRDFLDGLITSDMIYAIAPSDHY